MRINRVFNGLDSGKIGNKPCEISETFVGENWDHEDTGCGPGKSYLEFQFIDN